MSENFYPRDYLPAKGRVENVEQLREIVSALESDGCVKAITLPDGKMDAPPEETERIFGGQYFTQIEIIGGGREGVYLHKGRYVPSIQVGPYVNEFYYEDWNFGKEGEPNWQRHQKGN